MPSRVLIVIGHPDPSPSRFCRALAAAYRDGALDAGHEVREIDIAGMEVPLLRSKAMFEHGEIPPVIARAQEDILWAQHLMIIYPLWLGDVPALFKGFLEQVFRPGFAFTGDTSKGKWKKRLAGRTAHLAVTMGMPSIFYRVVYRAHSVKSLRENVLAFVGIRTVQTSLIGMVEADNTKAHEIWLAHMRGFGHEAS